MFMMFSKRIIEDSTLQARSPAEILARTNEALCDNNQAEMFVTVWYGCLDLETGVLEAANAGHEYPILKNADGSYTATFKNSLLGTKTYKKQ